MTQHSTVNVYELNPFNNFEKVKSVWSTLQEACPHSFFLSWEWVETWIKCLPSTQNIRFVYAEDKGKVIFCYFVGTKKGFGNSIVYCTRGYLNSTGDDLIDEITIEYNGFLLDPRVTMHDFSDLLAESIIPWDEFQCPAVSKEWLSPVQSFDTRFNVKVIESRLSYYIDLARVRSNGNNLLSLLSKNKRSQINRSIRNYEVNNKLTLELAGSKAVALEYLAGLEELHQKSWTDKGMSGSFASYYFKKFHIKMITDNFDKNHIHLFRISCGNEILGYLYCFSYQKKIYFYQSGLNYKSGNEFRPGLVCHTMVVNYYAEEGGYDSYDFLAGESAYKKSLSTDSCEMLWIKVRKDKLYFMLEDMMKAIKSYLLNNR